ncbi:hypothetical protein [Cellulomonas sp. P5_C5]
MLVVVLIPDGELMTPDDTDNYVESVEDVLPVSRVAAFRDGFDCGRAVGRHEGWCEGYVAGFGVGDEVARQAVEAEWRGRMVVSTAIARQIAQAGPYAELADRRGEHDHAHAQRAILRERGIA